MNKVILLGNAGKDAEALSDNVASFSLCTNRRFKDKNGEQVNESEWHTIKCFSKLSQLVAQYVKKGSQVLVEGRIHYSSFEKKDGTKVYATEIIADNVEFLSRAEGSAKPAPAPEVSDADQDLPWD